MSCDLYRCPRIVCIYQLLIDPGPVRLTDEFIVAEEPILISVIKRRNWPFSYFCITDIFIDCLFPLECCILFIHVVSIKRAPIEATTSYLLAGPFHLALNIDFMDIREHFTGLRGNTTNSCGINDINVSKCMFSFDFVFYI